MLFETIQNCCDFAVAALDGVYGWASEILAIALFVFIFNFLLKRLLKHLQTRFERQGKVWKESFVRAIYGPLSYFVWFFAIVQCLDLISKRVFVQLPIEDRHLILGCGALAMVTWFLLRWKNLIVERTILRAKTKEIAIDPIKIDAINKLATVGIVFFAILLFMEISHRSVNTIIAFGGVGGLALAFASQEIIANFFGGFMIYFTQPFTLGDWIVIPDHKIEGIVEEIGWYMTRVRSLDKRPIYIPNSIFSKLIVITPSRMSHRQIKEIIGIRCSDQPKIKTILQGLKEMLQAHPELDHGQPVTVRLDGFGQSSLDVLLSAYTLTTSTEGYLRIKEDVLLKVMDVLEVNGAEIATPTHHVSILNPASDPR